MQSLGNCKIRLAIFFFIVLISASSGQNNEHVYYYYTVSYADGFFGTDVLFSKIDLDSKTIVFSVRVPMRGEIQFKNPIIFNTRGGRFSFITTINGLSGKNSEAMNDSYSEYSIINDNRDIVIQNRIPNIQLTRFDTVNGSMANINYINADLPPF